ncbi:hypothetical protein IC582_010361 [Cucumis melo]|uniref:Late embryogenesis abundant protein 1 isoform X1 n=2 Tax=Cucumis melo TaxID=3656 RepID=A0A5A7SQZ2_CUCMM|nr:late embryogenesis abundant protein 1 [Cucumis melo]KAA0031971.1 late embryogenesis abundant protein 1 isoform X1 [Cucumis melo var. makuwa]TYK16791.1 late embryogenesis abundant protein 1 isoform X1 [Cucumis melo var. makuwa]
MSNMQQSLNAGQTKGQTQARTEEWMEATKLGPTSEPRDMSSNSAQAQLCANSAQHSTHQRDQEPTSFLQQTGEKMVHMAQGAVDTVKETLGMGDKK